MTVFPDPIPVLKLYAPLVKLTALLAVKAEVYGAISDVLFHLEVPQAAVDEVDVKEVCPHPTFQMPVVRRIDNTTGINALLLSEKVVIKDGINVFICMA